MIRLLSGEFILTTREFCDRYVRVIDKDTGNVYSFTSFQLDRLDRLSDNIRTAKMLSRLKRILPDYFPVTVKGLEKLCRIIIESKRSWLHIVNRMVDPFVYDHYNNMGMRYVDPVYKVSDTDNKYIMGIDPIKSVKSKSSLRAYPMTAGECYYSFNPDGKVFVKFKYDDIDVSVPGVIKKVTDNKVVVMYLCGGEENNIFIPKNKAIWMLKKR